MVRVSDPSDSDIENILRQALAERWVELSSAVDAVEEESEHTTWEGGYAVYSAATDRMVRALYDLGAIVPFDWPNWDRVEGYRTDGGTALQEASVADAVRMVTAIVRADRFTEGTIGAELEAGTLLAALRRLRRWYEEELA